MTQKLDCSRREFLADGGRILAGGALSGIASASESVHASIAREAGGKVPVIDCHVHVGVARLAGTPWDLTDPWYTFNDPELVLRHMEEAGIDRSIIFSIENVTYEKANEEVAEICRRYPEKFIGICSSSPRA